MHRFTNHMVWNQSLYLIKPIPINLSLLQWNRSLRAVTHTVRSESVPNPWKYVSRKLWPNSDIAFALVQSRIHVQARCYRLEYVILRGATAECSRCWLWFLSRQHLAIPLYVLHSLHVTQLHTPPLSARSQLGFIRMQCASVHTNNTVATSVRLKSSLGWRSGLVRKWP
jgi:hypothetical protein